MTRYIEFVVQEEGIVARAELWDELAPTTCEAIWHMLPLSGHFHHAMYSGPAVGMSLPGLINTGQEHATATVLPWEIGFASFRSEDYFEVDRDFSEICFFYDRGARPSMMEGPIKVNLFAYFISGQQGLYRVCRRMRTEGQKRFTIQRVTSSRQGGDES